jgi:hypothetical protein
LDSHNRWRILSVVACPDTDAACDDAPFLGATIVLAGAAMQVAGKNISANNPRLCGRLRLLSNALRPAKITKEIS